jgi:hypothetical protein
VLACLIILFGISTITGGFGEDFFFGESLTTSIGFDFLVGESSIAAGGLADTFLGDSSTTDGGLDF